MSTKIAFADSRKPKGSSMDDPSPLAVFGKIPGPALLFDKRGSFAGLNAEGQWLASFIQQHPDSTAVETLVGICGQVQKDKSSLVHSFVVTRDDSNLWIDATILSDDMGNVILLCRNATIDVNMRTALIDSRQRYKDLVEISSDFAWEADINGIFTFVSPRGAMGFPASTIVGAAALAFLFVPDTAQQEFAFESRHPVERSEIWMRDSEGNPVCLLASAKPLFTPDGQFSGVRGVCRDVTADRMRENELARRKAREQVVDFIVDAVRNEAKPDNMLKTAVRSVSRAMLSTSCAVYKTDDSGKLVSAAKHGNLPHGRRLSAIVNSLPTARESYETKLDEYQVFVETTHYRGVPNGATVLCRDAGGAPWDEDDRLLMQAVAGQLGIALQQIAEQQELILLSRTDSLTGLLNRRAFMEELERAKERTTRNRASSAILFLDLNNFKYVNDTQGHDAGDRVLKRLAEALHSATRSYDFVARLGGDEFVVWLENVDKETARRRAAAILASSRMLTDAVSHDPAKKLGLSIGIAIFDTDHPESAQELMSRADEAMYRAKNNNKKNIAIARHKHGSGQKSRELRGINDTFTNV